MWSEGAVWCVSNRWSLPRRNGFKCAHSNRIKIRVYRFDIRWIESVEETEWKPSEIANILLWKLFVETFLSVNWKFLLSKIKWTLNILKQSNESRKCKSFYVQRARNFCCTGMWPFSKNLIKLTISRKVIQRLCISCIASKKANNKQKWTKRTSRVLMTSAAPSFETSWVRRKEESFQIRKTTPRLYINYGKHSISRINSINCA